MDTFRRQMVAALGFALVALTLVGCESDDDPEATPTQTVVPSATATPNYGAPEPCPVDQEICDFAVEIQQLIAAADFAGLEAIMRPQEFVCPDREVGLGDPIPLCHGAEGGEVRSGFPIRRLQSDGGTVETSLLPWIRHVILGGVSEPVSAYVAPHPIGIHCALAGGVPDCTGPFVIYFEFPLPGMHFVVEREGAGFVIRSIQMGNTTDDRDFALHPGPLLLALESLVDGWFYPWKGQQFPDPDLTVPRRWLLAPPEVTGVVVSPASGPCPTTLTLTFPEAPVAEPGKEPLPSVWIVAGVSGIEVGIPGRPPLVEQNPPWLADGRSFEVQLDADMLGGTLCDGDTVSFRLGGGPDGWVLAGYAIERP